MSQREVAIKGGPYGTKAMVTGQEELLVKINNSSVATTIVENNTAAISATSIYRFTGSATISAAVKVTFKNVGLADATISIGASGTSAALKPTESVTFEALIGKQLMAIAITATGTEVLTTVIS
jgi:hypothetical protein